MTLNYKPAEAHTLYMRLARGFKSGGFNAGPSSNPARIEFAPEYLNSYEVGYKGAPSGRVRIDTSLFYHYFQSKADIAQEVLTDMLEAFKLEVGRRQKDADPLATIHYANQRMVALYANNPGAMRCLVDSKDDSAPFAQTWRSITLDWNRRIAASIARQFPDALPRNDAYLALAFALSGMVDDFLFEYFVNEQAALRQAYPTHDAVAAFLTTLWCRALYLRNPGDITSPGFTEVSGDPGL